MNEITTIEEKPLIPLSDEMQALLATQAKEQSSAEKGAIPFVSIKGKKFTLEDVKLGTEIDVVILATSFDNAYYDAPYNPDEIRPPACFAINVSTDDMVPHETSPLKQNKTCKSCPQNEYGTATQGKGKACKNGRRLLLAAYDEKGVDLDNLAILRIPPTSLKGCAGYIKQVSARRNRPICTMVTTLSFDEDSDWPVIQFEYTSSLESEEVLRNILSNLDAFQQMVETPYDVSGFTPYEEPSSSKKSKIS